MLLIIFSVCVCGDVILAHKKKAFIFKPLKVISLKMRSVLPTLMSHIQPLGHIQSRGGSFFKNHRHQTKRPSNTSQRTTCVRDSELYCWWLPLLMLLSPLAILLQFPFNILPLCWPTAPMYPLHIPTECNNACPCFPLGPAVWLHSSSAIATISCRTAVGLQKTGKLMTVDCSHNAHSYLGRGLYKTRCSHSR